MKYIIKKDITENYEVKNIKQDVLTFRGINNIDDFISPKKTHCFSFDLLNNIDGAVYCLLSHLESNHNILIVVDSDNDGYTSAAILFNYIKNIYPDSKLDYIIHSKKQHGLDKNLHIKSNVNLIILPDGTSEDYEEYSKYKNKNIDIILLDHHLAKKESKDAIVVNNQLSNNYPNKELSGAGIVYKFCEALDFNLWYNYAINYLDLVAVGNIGDVMDCRSLETRYYIIEGLKNINNKLLQQFIKQQNINENGGLNTNAVIFSICPLINAIIRVGTMADKELLFRGLINDYEEFKYKEKNNSIINENIYERIIRIALECKEKQGKIKDKSIKYICNTIEKNNLDNNKILIVDSNGNVDRSLTGLICQNITEIYQKPVLIGVATQNTNNELMLSGSGRNYGNCAINSLKQLLEETNNFGLLSGHDNAFGFELQYDRIEETNKLLNNKLQNIKFEKQYNVDFLINKEQLKNNLFTSLAEIRNIWGHNVQEPLFLIKDIECDIKNIVEFSKGKHYKFKINNYGEEITFINFNYNDKDELINYITSFDCWTDKVNLNIIGKININIYNGASSIQVLIDDLEIIEN